VAVAWLRDHVTAKSCEELISPDVCKKIKDFAKKVHVSVSDVMQAVKEAIAEGAWDPKDLYQKAVEYLKAKISCEAVIGKSTCDKIRALADKFGIALTRVDEVMREAIARGVTKVSELYKTVVKWIMDQWTDLIGDEEMYEQQDFIDIKGKLQEALLQAAERIVGELSGVTDVVRHKIRELIIQGKVRISQLKKKIMDLIAEYGPSADVQDQIDELKEQLKIVLAKAKGMTKILIERLLSLSREKLAQAKALIKKILQEYGMDHDEFVDLLLDETHEQILKDVEEETEAFTGMIFEDMIDNSQL
jgi:BMFP domain-containing protein YqiC